jgi:hypothetical protein
MKMLRATPVLASALLALIAFAPLGQVHAATQTINFSKTQTFGNITVTISASITIDTTAKTITGTVSITAVNDTSGQTIFSKTFNINTSYASTGSTNSASFVLVIPTVGEVLGASCMANASTGASSCLISKNPDVDHDGVMNILDVAAVASSFGASNSAYDLNNHGVVDITDIAVVAADFNAPVIW